MQCLLGGWQNAQVTEVPRVAGETTEVPDVRHMCRLGVTVAVEGLRGGGYVAAPTCVQLSMSCHHHPNGIGCWVPSRQGVGLLGHLDSSSTVGDMMTVPACNRSLAHGLIKTLCYRPLLDWH
jgi:hypothetical protein